MRFIDFFAGVGGFRRGMELAGHECVGFCEWDKFATASYISMHLITEEQRQHLEKLNVKMRQKEILKGEYRNGEWYARDIRTVRVSDLPRADCWCAGFPCQDISVAGKQLGFRGERSSLFFAVTGLIKSLEEEDRPSYLFFENVKNLLSVNRGFDFAKLLIELDEIGYDAEWQVLNSKDFGVPQNRERIFIVGHLRRRCTRQVFPVDGTASENHCQQLIGGAQGMRVYDASGASCTLKGESGGLGGKTGLYAVPEPKLCDMNYGAGLNIQEIASCLQARYHKGVCNHRREATGVAVPVLTPERTNKRQNGRRFKEDGAEMFTLTAADRHGVLVEDKPQVVAGIGEKNFGKQFRQGNRIYNADKVSPALTSQPVGGTGGNTPLFAVEDSGVNEDGMLKIKTNTAKGYEFAGKGDAINFAFPNSKTRRGRVGKGVAQTLDCSCKQGTLQGYRIRRLTPKECFRLQSWTDDYFEKARFVNSDNQLYRQAGNGVTVNVIKAIAEKMDITNQEERED